MWWDLDEILNGTLQRGQVIWYFMSPRDQALGCEMGDGTNQDEHIIDVRALEALWIRCSLITACHAYYRNRSRVFSFEVKIPAIVNHEMRIELRLCCK